MSTPRLEDTVTNEECQEVARLFLKHGAKRAAAQEMGIDEKGFAKRLAIGKARGLWQLDGLKTKQPSILYAPPPEPPKLRVSVSHVKSEPGWNGDVLAIGDMHDSPKLNKDRFLWCGRAAVELNVDRIVQIGDILSVDSLCKMEGNDTLRGKDKPSFETDIQSGHDALSAFDRGLQGADIERHITLGNHEERALSFTNRTPEVAGMLTGMVDNLFMSHGWTYSPYGLMYFIGSVGFIHVPLNVMGRPYGGKTAINRIGNDCLHDIVYGHTHVGGLLPVRKIGTNQSITVLDLNCCLPEGHIEPYVGHATSGWKYGPHLIKIRDGRISSTQFITMTELEERFGD